MLTDLRVSVIALDFMMARGGQDDAKEVLAAIRSSGRVVLAQAMTREMQVRSFLFQTPQFPEGRVNIAADSDGVHRRYSYGVNDPKGCQPSLALASYLMWQEATAELSCVGQETLTWKELGAGSEEPRRSPTAPGDSPSEFPVGVCRALGSRLQVHRPRKSPRPVHPLESRGCRPKHHPARNSGKGQPGLRRRQCDRRGRYRLDALRP
jgi:hypothetical protein